MTGPHRPLGPPYGTGPTPDPSEPGAPVSGPRRRRQPDPYLTIMVVGVCAELLIFLIFYFGFVN